MYDKQIRCMVEFSTPVWTSGLTKAEVSQIERIQKAAFAIILGKGYTSYSRALKQLKRSMRNINMGFASAIQVDKSKKLEV